MADFASFPKRDERDADQRRGALALKALVDAAIANKTAKPVPVTPEMIADYERRAMGIAIADAKARTNRGGNSAAKRSIRARANAWKNGVTL